MTDINSLIGKLLTTKEVAHRWQQSVQTINRCRKLGMVPWIDLSGGKNTRPVVRFRLSDIEAYEEKMRLHPMPCDKKANPLHEEHESSFSGKSEKLSQPLSLSDEGSKLIRRFHASK